MGAYNILCDPNARIVVAHRGNRAGAPENTLESFIQAVELGADAIELDVRMTRDGVPVILHDAELDRTTSGHGRLDAHSFAEIRTLDAGPRDTAYPPSPQPPPPAPLRQGAGRVTIPSLEEVLDRFRETPLVIEVKEFGAVEATERLVRRFAAHERVVIGSSDNAVIQRFYRSGLMTCASMFDAALLIVPALFGATPTKPRYDVLSVTPRFHGVPLPIRGMAAAARKVGVATQVWTVNDPAQARSFWGAGVAGIVTDDPAALIRARSS